MFLDKQMNLLHINFFTILGAFQTAAFMMGLRMNEKTCKPFKKRILVSYSPLGPVGISPIGFDNQTLWEFVSGAHPKG